jgi:hypothetical protein
MPRMRRSGAPSSSSASASIADPATAGVIGDTRFSYDVWGDAVNVAARMESHGLPGRIQVSEHFHGLTRDVLRVRGTRRNRHQGDRRDEDLFLERYRGRGLFPSPACGRGEEVVPREALRQRHSPAAARG